MAVTPFIQPGVVFAMVQNTIYALPTMRCLLFTDGTTPTIQQSLTLAFTANVAVTLDTNAQAEVAGGFIRCTSGNINVMLKNQL